VKIDHNDQDAGARILAETTLQAGESRSGFAYKPLCILEASSIARAISILNYAGS